MKPKYEKMIDEYVKKHYGDLERGVLAPEVKYKVLFKIYRKKLKEKKSEVKVLRSLLKLYHITSGNDALMGPDESKVLPKEDGFNQVAGAMKNCTLCRHSRMLSALNYEGAYTSCLWCDKKNEKRSALDEVCEDFE